MSSNIVLIGFMGSGKTTIGRALAKLCNTILLDTDSLIVSNYNMSIKQFFHSFGEEKFREAEIFLCNWIKQNVNNTIISTGGGLPLRYNSRDLGNVIYLKVPFSKLIERIQREGVNKRPMFKDVDSIINLYKQRISYYESSANYTLNAGDDIKNNAREIFNYVKGC